jgi:hypothetical protein
MIGEEIIKILALYAFFVDLFFHFNIGGYFWNKKSREDRRLSLHFMNVGLLVSTFILLFYTISSDLSVYILFVVCTVYEAFDPLS